SIHEIICFPNSKPWGQQVQASALIEMWKQGIVVDDIETPPHSMHLLNPKRNPLLQMKSYAFIQQALQNRKSPNTNGQCICISEDMLLEDILMLWKWLMEQLSSAVNSTANANTNTNTNTNNSLKYSLQMLKSRSKIQRLALTYQLKYRKELKQRKTHFAHSKRRRSHNANEHNSDDISFHSLDMHCRSLILHIYEIAFMFLHLQCQMVWYPSFLTHFIHFKSKHDQDDNNNNNNNNNNDNDEKENQCTTLFRHIPSLLLKVKCSKKQNKKKQIWTTQWQELLHWKKQVQERFDHNNIVKDQVKLQLPYVWLVFDSKLFHWICDNFSLTKHVTNTNNICIISFQLSATHKSNKVANATI
ncbi:hypothetical protein RFI_24649, partial [Reticulomyxa filosa]